VTLIELLLKSTSKDILAHDIDDSVLVTLDGTDPRSSGLGARLISVLTPVTVRYATGAMTGRGKLGVTTRMTNCSIHHCTNSQ
jgi:hypothetical protein